MYLASLVGEGNREGRLDIVGVDSSLSPPVLVSCLCCTMVLSAELSGVVFGVVKLDLIPALSFRARLWRALFDFFCSGTGVLWAGPCGVVRVDWNVTFGLGDGRKLKVCGLKVCGLNPVGVGCNIWVCCCGTCWMGCCPVGGW